MIEDYGIIIMFGSIWSLYIAVLWLIFFMYKLDHFYMLYSKSISLLY